MNCLLLRRARQGYLDALAEQRALHEAIVQGRHANVLLLTEHDPVYTVGLSGGEGEWRESRAPAIPVVRVDRGGKTTWHGPGQVVGYALLDLRPRHRLVRAFVWKLEEVVIRTLAGLELVGERDPHAPGVWVAGAKVAAVGVRVKGGVTYHGFALNRDVDPSGFAAIRPCGLERPVTSLAALERNLDRDELEERLVAVFGEVFEVAWIGAVC